MAMKFSRQQNSSGVALLIVMIAIAVFTALAAALAFSMKVETKLAMNAGHEQQLLWLGRSGVEYARWILAQEAYSGPALRRAQPDLGRRSGGDG